MRSSRDGWLVSEDVLIEYAAKLLEKGIDPLRVEQFVADILQYGEEVPIRFFHFQHYPVDMDDVAFLLVVLNGAASHLVTYDEHLNLKRKMRMAAKKRREHKDR